MRYVSTRDAEEFARRAGGFLESRPECNIVAGVLSDALARAYVESPHFVYGLNERDEVAFAALRTQPWPLLTSPLDPVEARAFMAAWLGQDPRPPGVNGLTATARAIAEAWCAHTGGTARAGLRQAMHVLSEVTDPPRPAPGRLRQAGVDELDLLLQWWAEFGREAGIGVRPGKPLVRARIDQGRVFVWECGEPVSMVAIAADVAGVTRIGPVYTPLERRCRGYAGTAVAALSRLAIERGAHTCMLFTDLANPTSNKIYGEVGYRRVADWEEQRFVIA